MNDQTTTTTTTTPLALGNEGHTVEPATWSSEMGFDAGGAAGADDAFVVGRQDLEADARWTACAGTDQTDKAGSRPAS